MNQSRINHVERARLSWINDFEETSNHIPTRDSVLTEIKQSIHHKSHIYHYYLHILTCQFSIYHTCDIIIFYAVTYN